MKMLNTILKGLKDYEIIENDKFAITLDINDYKDDEKISGIRRRIDALTLFKGLFSEDENAIQGRLDLIQKINEQKIEDLDNNIQDQLSNEIKYSMYA